MCGDNKMKTIKQIADELEIDKQRVYRYIKKNHINEAHQRKGVMYYDDVAENVIKQGFLDKITSSEVHHEVHQNHINETVIDTLLKQSEMLQKELEIKNKQIEELNERLSENQKLLNQEQQLHAMTKQDLKLLEVKVEEQKIPKKGIFKFLKKKNNIDE